VFISVADRDKRSIVFPVKRLRELGFKILATEGTASVLRRNGIECHLVRKASEGPSAGGQGTIVDLIASGQVDMVINTPSGQGARADGYEIRAAITGVDKPIVTTIQQLGAAVQAIEVITAGPFKVSSLQATAPQRTLATRGAVPGDD
jgi:carbamoyl-phosphate synthase large subunit